MSSCVSDIMTISYYFRCATTRGAVTSLRRLRPSTGTPAGRRDPSCQSPGRSDRPWSSTGGLNERGTTQAAKKTVVLGRGYKLTIPGFSSCFVSELQIMNSASRCVNDDKYMSLRDVNYCLLGMLNGLTARSPFQISRNFRGRGVQEEASSI